MTIQSLKMMKQSLHIHILIYILVFLNCNRRSGVALAMRHRLSGIPTYRLNGLRKGGEPEEYGTFYLLLNEHKFYV